MENNIIVVLWSRNSTWSDLHPQFRIVFSLFSEFREDTTTTFYQWDIFIYIQYFDLIADWPWLLHLMRWFILCLSNCCCMIWKIWAGVWRFVRFTIRDHKYMYFGILHFVTPINSSLKIHFSLDHCIKVLYIASIPHPSSLNKIYIHVFIFLVYLGTQASAVCTWGVIWTSSQTSNKEIRGACIEMCRTCTWRDAENYTTLWYTGNNQSPYQGVFYNTVSHLSDLAGCILICIIHCTNIFLFSNPPNKLTVGVK
mgnify:CR=1 FL=1